MQVKKRKPRFQNLSDDAIWIAEQEIARTKKTLLERDGTLTPQEHARFIKTAEQIRKLRMTDAELNKINDPGELEELQLDEEFEERCRSRGLDPALVCEVFNL